MAKKKAISVNGLKKKRIKQRGILNASKVAMIERRFQVMKLRRDGHTFKEIGEALGIDGTVAHSDLVHLMSTTIKECAEDVEENRALQVARLDNLLLTYTPFATQWHKETRIDEKTGMEFIIEVPPNPVYAKLILDIEARRAKLLALDVPETKKLEVSGIREYIGVDLDKV